MLTLLLNVGIGFIIFLLIIFAIVIAFAVIQTIKVKKQTKQIINKTFNIDSSKPNDLAKLIKQKIDEDL
ncbi:hypothetical protein [Lactococcus lactis]|uniref:hypothetical protein n=1 Tax=Lactococcus lactis TaxID=1358 RepID=UPI00071D1FFE|nr:hypothetical protein [Lactococcus lactis]KST89930.1 hypothetical protein LKF24_2125 [Lactococcus lactis subsp. lactis]